MIEKIVMRPYRGTDKWEADVFMLIDGETVPHRWCSPLPSKQASAPGSGRGARTMAPSDRTSGGGAEGT